MGNRIPASILVRLADAAGNSMEVSDAALAQAFLKNYTDAIGRPAVIVVALSVAAVFVTGGKS